MSHIERDETLKSWIRSLKHVLRANIMACYLIEGEEEPYLLDSVHEFTVVLVIRNIELLMEFRRALIARSPDISGLIDDLYLFTPDSLRRHFELDPRFGQLLVKKSRLIFGERLLPQPLIIKNEERFATLAGAAFCTSTVLAPSLVDARQLQINRQKLERASIRHENGEQGSTGTRALYYSLLRQLLQELSAAKDIPWLELPPEIVKTVGPAYFEWEKRLLVAIPHSDRNSSHDIIERTEWDTLAELLGERYGALHIVPTEILRYHLYLNEPASIRLRNIDHLRGPNVIEDLEPPLHAVFRNLGQIANNLLIKSFPRVILNAADDQLETVLHNYQNALLNIQLRNELLSKMEELPTTSPKKSRVPKGSSMIDRVNFVISQLDWWATYHLSQLSAAK